MRAQIEPLPYLRLQLHESLNDGLQQVPFCNGLLHDTIHFSQQSLSEISLFCAEARTVCDEVAEALHMPRTAV